MAIDEPSASPTPPVPAPVPASAPQRPRRRGRILLILAIAIAAALVVGGGTAFVLYDKATAIDRSTPAVVIDQFLDAALVLKDPNRVTLFICSSWSAGAAMSKSAAPTDPRVRASWGDITAVENGESATAAATIRFSVANGGDASRSVQRWRFDLKDQGGWRVCDVNKG